MLVSCDLCSTAGPKPNHFARLRPGWQLNVCSACADAIRGLTIEERDVPIGETDTFVATFNALNLAGEFELWWEQKPGGEDIFRILRRNAVTPGRRPSGDT